MWRVAWVLLVVGAIVLGTYFALRSTFTLGQLLERSTCMRATDLRYANLYVPRWRRVQPCFIHARCKRWLY